MRNRPTWTSKDKTLMISGPGHETQPDEPAVPISGTNTCSMPVELILAVMRLCDARSVARCRTVTKQFQIIIDGTPELQYMIALYTSGCDENAHLLKSMLVPERLQLLHRYQYSWKAARLVSRKITVAISAYSIIPWYHGNILIRPALTGAMQLMGNPHNTLICQCFIPSGSAGILAKSWNIEPAHAFCAFASNTEYNLVAILSSQNAQYNIHLLRLSDGTSHGEMKISSSARTLTGLITMRFEGDILGVARYCLTGEILDLYLFNWKNGSLVANLTHRSDQYEMSMKGCFSFISSTSFILGMSCSGCFYAIQLYSMDGMMIPIDGTVPSPRHIATFQLPVFQRQCILTNAMTFSKTIHGSFARNVSTTPFFAAPSSAMLRIDRVGARRANPACWTYITIFVHLSAFSEILGNQPRNPVDSPDFFPWETWGPRYTRCFDEAGSTNYPLPAEQGRLYASYGTRIVYNDSLLDFNQMSVSQELNYASYQALNATESTSKSDSPLPPTTSHRMDNLQAGKMINNVDPPPSRIVTAPTIIPRGQFFENDVESALPYRETHIAWPGNVRPKSIYGGEVWIMQGPHTAIGLPTFYTLSLDSTLAAS